MAAAIGSHAIPCGRIPCDRIPCARIPCDWIPLNAVGRWLVFWFVFTLPLALIGTFGSLGAGASGSGAVSIAFIPAGMLLAFGYYGLDYCATQLQNPFIAEFGDVQLDGRFLLAVCEDVDMLLRVERGGDGPDADS
jgi:predicted membrane chloride channel (bestrophin family)